MKCSETAGGVGKKATEGLVRDPAESAMRIPDAEEIISAGSQNTMDFAVGLALVGIEQHAELAHHHIKAGVGNGTVVASAD